MSRADEVVIEQELIHAAVDAIHMVSRIGGVEFEPTDSDELELQRKSDGTVFRVELEVSVSEVPRG